MVLLVYKLTFTACFFSIGGALGLFLFLSFSQAYIGVNIVQHITQVRLQPSFSGCWTDSKRCKRSKPSKQQRQNKVAWCHDLTVLVVDLMPNAMRKTTFLQF